MIFGDSISIEMSDGRYINGTAHAPGERIKLPPHEAHEIVAYGWAKFLRPGDEVRARQAFIEHERAKLARLQQQPVPRDWPTTPWQPLR
jgi:hypothetical protein